MSGVVTGKGKQAGSGVYAVRDFKKGEVFKITQQKEK